MATNGAAQHKALIPFSSRLKEGRALAEDVWSIYKCDFTPGPRQNVQLTIDHRIVLQIYLLIV
jgi:hypothetical protein